MTVSGPEHCTCTCGLPGCISSPERINRAGITIHDRHGYARGCRCEVCKEDAYAKKREKFARRNGETLQKAASHRQPWTDAELEVAAREDLTDYEAGVILGRTMQAVKRARDRYGLTRKAGKQ